MGAADRPRGNVALRVVVGGLFLLASAFASNVFSTIFAAFVTGATLIALWNEWQHPIKLAVYSTVSLIGLLSLLGALIQAWRRAAKGADIATDGLRSSITELKTEVAALAAQSTARIAPEIRARIPGIATVEAVVIAWNDAEEPHHWECRCDVFFHGMADGVSASPSELELTGPGGKPLLATLKASHLAQVRGITQYTGIGERTAIGAAISSTMGELMNIFPPRPSTFCSVEVRLPSGEARQSHNKSGVKMSFEDAGMDHHAALVRITTIRPIAAMEALFGGA